VINWPSYRLEELDDLPLELPAGVTPGKHTTRKGWLTRDYHFERSPFATDIDAEVWTTTRGRRRSLRQIGLSIADFFREAIRRHADPFSYALVFAVLEGRAMSMLELDDRPLAYEDFGRMARWGSTIAELEEHNMLQPGVRVAERSPIREHMSDRLAVRDRYLAGDDDAGAKIHDDSSDEVEHSPLRRAVDFHAAAAPPWNAIDAERRSLDISPPDGIERRRSERRRSQPPPPFANELDRSAYELAFIRLAAREPLRVGDSTLVPVGMNGWYEAIFEDQRTGEEKRISIDELRRLVAVPV
jgi:hypothetical protein